MYSVLLQMKRPFTPPQEEELCTPSLCPRQPLLGQSARLSGLPYFQITINRWNVS